MFFFVRLRFSFICLAFLSFFRYASNAGKSGGEFFTPADVSELLTRLGTVGKTEVNKVYEKQTWHLIQFNVNPLRGVA